MSDLHLQSYFIYSKTAMIRQSFVSATEASFVVAGCNDGIRNDGRDITDFRCLQIENNIFPHCNGSSRLKLCDSTDILCSIKAEVTEFDRQDSTSKIIIKVLKRNLELMKRSKKCTFIIYKY